jgi:serine/threonine-protein kinase
MAMKHMEETPRAPSAVRPDNGISPELDALILRCLSKKPEDRPADGLALLTLLIPIASAMPWNPELARDWWNQHVPAESSAT